MFLSHFEDLVFNTFTTESELKGSSYNMRLLQLVKSFEIFTNHPFLGHGFLYSGNLKDIAAYSDLHGIESLLFQVLINHGLAGILAYSMLFGNLIKFYISRSEFLLAFGIITYVIFVVATGPMLSFPWFIIINVLAMRYVKYKSILVS